MNNNTRLSELLALIPENSENEALMSIQTIVTIPMAIKLQISCYFSHKFVIFVKGERTGNGIKISADGWKIVSCNDNTLVSALKKFIYELDDAISNGFVQPKKQKQPEVIPDYPAPAYMDIPVWDIEHKRWYDAEC